MPSSTPKHVSFIIQEIMNINPKTILDIGVGFGKWGMLCREYLEVWNRRFKKQDWECHITGVEPFYDYVNEATRYYYDVIYNARIEDMMKHLTDYDLTLAIDVIEHIDKLKAKIVLSKLRHKTRNLILSLPLGPEWLGANQSYVRINPLEAHVSSWEVPEVTQILGPPKRFTDVEAERGSIGIFVY